MDNPRWEPLTKTCRVLVTDTHGFTTDTLLLASFSMPNKGEICADLGTGCGVIPLLWAARAQPQHIYAVEIQEQGALQAEQSVKENGFSSLIEVICGDAKDYRGLFSHGGLDRIACNPPYFARERGLTAKSPKRELTRGEESFSLEELAQGAKYALKHGGRLCICQRPERLGEAMGIFSSYGLEPKRLRLVQQRRDKPPFLFLLECRRGGRPGLNVEPTLLISDQGGYTPEMLEIYGDYGAAGEAHS